MPSCHAFHKCKTSSYKKNLRHLTKFPLIRHNMEDTDLQKGACGLITSVSDLQLGLWSIHYTAVALLLTPLVSKETCLTPVKAIFLRGPPGPDSLSIGCILTNIKESMCKTTPYSRTMLGWSILCITAASLRNSVEFDVILSLPKHLMATCSCNRK